MRAYRPLIGSLLVLMTLPAASFAADLDHPHPFDPSQYPDRAAWEKRAAFLRDQARVAQGLWPVPEKAPLAPVVHGKIEREGYTVEKVFFASLPGHYVTGNLYRPAGRAQGKRPVVLAPYGHWPNGRFMWRDDAGVQKDLDGGAETDRNAARSPLQANCVQLARMGCVVFHYDMVGYGDSTTIPHREGFTDAQAVMRLQSFMGLQTWNSIRALDFVLSLPDVDETRVAVAGSSGGGMQTIALAALDDRVDVAFPMVMVSMNMQGGCVCENAPLWRVHTNNVELACLFAPKPQGMAAANDWTHDFMKRGLPEMKSIWRLYDAEQDVAGDHVDFGHNHNLHSRRLQYRFLNKHLKLNLSEPIEERPFEPLRPEELSVYDAQHPRPADVADADTLKKTMTAASDAQLTKLPHEQYVQTVRTALRAMVVDDGTRDLMHTSHTSSMPSDWDGNVLIWWDPKYVHGSQRGKLGRYAVYAPARLASPATAPATKKADPKRSYAGFTLGYNRSVIAQEVCDLLDLVARIRRDQPGVKSIKLIATGDGAPAALLARALAGDAIDRAAIDLAQFDFDRVTREDDARLLPGALKYGGIYGFVPLCDSGQTLLCNARQIGSIDRARQTPNVTVETEPRRVEQMIEWLVQPR